MKIFKFKNILPQIPNIVFRNTIKFEFEMIPFEANKLTLKKRLNFVIAGLNQFFLSSRPLGYPVISQVEPTNYCNLSCPLCYTTSENKSRAETDLSFENFKTFIDQFGDYLLLIVLWAWGEPFLNPDIFKIISYAKKKNILIHTSTNGNVAFNAQQADELVKSGLDSLVIAVDGANQETYSKYRKKGNLKTVFKTIETIVKAKKRAVSSYPKVTIRTVITKHNEKDIPILKEISKKLNVDYFTIKSVAMPNAPGGKLDKHYIPKKEEYRMYKYDENNNERQISDFICMRPWKRITVDAHGQVIPCEFDYKSQYSFGAFQNNRKNVNIWKSDKAELFRKSFSKGNNSYYLCKNCIYKGIVAEDCTIERLLE